jgi:hypothetical protein
MRYSVSLMMRLAWIFAHEKGCWWAAGIYAHSGSEPSSIGSNLDARTSLPTHTKYLKRGQLMVQITMLAPRYPHTQNH